MIVASARFTVKLASVFVILSDCSMIIGVHRIHLPAISVITAPHADDIC